MAEGFSWQGTCWDFLRYCCRLFIVWIWNLITGHSQYPHWQGNIFFFLHGWTARIRVSSPSVLALWIPSSSRGCCDFNPHTLIKHLSSSGYSVFYILPEGRSFLESSMLESIYECTDRALVVPSISRRKSSQPFSYHTQLSCLLSRLLLGISGLFFATSLWRLHFQQPILTLSSDTLSRKGIELQLFVQKTTLKPWQPHLKWGSQWLLTI